MFYQIGEPRESALSVEGANTPLKLCFRRIQFGVDGAAEACIPRLVVPVVGHPFHRIVRSRYARGCTRTLTLEFGAQLE